MTQSIQTVPSRGLVGPLGPVGIFNHAFYLNLNPILNFRREKIARGLSFNFEIHAPTLPNVSLGTK